MAWCRSATWRGCEAAGRAVEPQPGRVQHLVRVDVAQPGDGVLVQQQRLEGPGAAGHHGL